MNNKKPPKRVNRKALFESKLVNFYADTVVMPNGHQIDSFYYLEFGFSTVAVIVERSDNCILLEEVARYPTQSVKWELPIGIIEADENMLDAAKREVHEETGYDTTQHKHLHSYHPVAGFSNMDVHIVHCKSEQQTGKIDPNEVESIRWFSPEEIRSLISQNEIADGFTLTGVLFHFQNK